MLIGRQRPTRRDPATGPDRGDTGRPPREAFRDQFTIKSSFGGRLWPTAVEGPGSFSGHGVRQGGTIGDDRRLILHGNRAN